MKKLQMNNCKLKPRLSSVISSISGADAKLKRHTLRVAAFLVVVLLITGSFFDSSLTAFSASDDEEEAYCDLTLEVYPEGEGSDKAVYLNGMMPKDASATAVDVSSDFKKRDGSTNISEDNPDASLVAAYDITITSGRMNISPMRTSR